MTKKTLASIKAAFGDQDKNQNSGGNFQNYYPFWNMKVGERAVIRFLPDRNEDNPRGFLVEKLTHQLTINGQRKTVPCLTQYGEECPVCKVSAEYYKVKDEANGKKYWKKRSYNAQILVVEDPLPADKDSGENAEGKLKLISLGFQIYNIIKEAFASDDFESLPYGIGGEEDDVDEHGYDFIIKKTAQGEYATYAVGTKFQNRSRPLTEAELEEIEANSIDLSTTLPKNPGIEKIQALLNADLNGEDYEEDADGDEDDDPPFVPDTKVKKPAAPAPKAEPKVESKPAAKSSDDDAAAESVDDMLAAIRARKKAQQQG